MTQHYHAIVWIDHREAKVFPFDAGEVERVVVESHAAGRHTQHRANVTGAGHRGVDKEFFGRVADALEGVGAILITGPANAKLEFRNFLNEHRPELAKLVSAVETLDHPSDGELLGLARRFFKADDRMHSQTR
jgi:stalled ribosome rescue protein Dom34